MPVSAVPDIEVERRVLGGVEIPYLAVGVDSPVNQAYIIFSYVAKSIACEGGLRAQGIRQVLDAARGRNAVRLTHQFDHLAFAHAHGELGHGICGDGAPGQKE